MAKRKDLDEEKLKDPFAFDDEFLDEDGESEDFDDQSYKEFDEDDLDEDSNKSSKWQDDEVDEDQLDPELEDEDTTKYDDEDDELEDDLSASDSEEGATLSPQDITLQVSCEIGNVNLSLEQISKLRLGDSLELIKWPGKVNLKLNGLVFAEGYLVEINGMLGVKITNKISKILKE